MLKRLHTHSEKAVSDMKREIHFPLSDALQISLEHIRKRLTRSIIVVASTALGTSYLTYFLATNTIISSSLGKAGESVEAYHFWLIVISIFICGVSLVNSTLISVLERYREIGMMKCIGALDRHILSLLVIEAFLLGLAGGVIGFTFGAATSIVSCYFELGFNVFQGLPLTGISALFGLVILFSVTLSVISTAYPAIRAARLNPVEALHYDV